MIYMILLIKYHRYVWVENDDKTSEESLLFL